MAAALRVRVCAVALLLCLAWSGAAARRKRRKATWGASGSPFPDSIQLPPPQDKPGEGGSRICIVGAGVGGSTLANFIKRESAFRHDIQVFERTPFVGGRAHLVEVDGELFEAGASIIHDKNKHLSDLADLLGLEREKPPSGDWAIWNGSKFVFRQMKKDKYPWPIPEAFNYLSLMFRYGLHSLYQMNNFVQDTLEKWMALYEPELPSFGTPEELLNHLGLFPLTLTTLADALKEELVLSRLVQELVTATMRIQYGQPSTITALAGAVGLVGTGGALWQVKEGNWLLAEGALRMSTATVHTNTTVTEVETVAEGGGYILHFEDGGERACDAVAIASPLSENGIKFNPPIDLPLRRFQRTHTTFVRGTVNKAYFGLENSDDDVPSMVATLEVPSIPFSVISRQRSELPDKAPVFKLFSREALSDELISQLFSTHETVVRVDWAAYPAYNAPEDFSPFSLDGHRLFYLNTFEDAASAMETAAVAAKNVAKLIVKATNSEMPTFSRMDDVMGTQEQHEEGKLEGPKEEL